MPSACLCSSLYLASLAGSALFCLQTLGSSGSRSIDLHLLLPFSCMCGCFACTNTKIQTMMQFDAFCITLRKPKTREVIITMPSHAGAGASHAPSPQHCAVLRSLPGAQQHVLCHRAYEGNVLLFTTCAGTCVTFSQLVTASDLTALLQALIVKPALPSNPLSGICSIH